MKKLLLKLAYRYLIKESYDFLPYLYCGEIYKVTSTRLSYDTKEQKTTIVVTAEREW